MKVLIVGGGIGGLTTALALQARGVDCVVCEQSSEIRELGVGVNTLPHAIKELAKLGLLDALDRVGVRTAELIYKTASGQPILRQPRGLDAGYDFPQFSIHRGKLQAVLLEAVQTRLGAQSVRVGHKLTAFTQDKSGVTAEFETPDGPTSMAADVMIDPSAAGSVGPPFVPRSHPAKNCAAVTVSTVQPPIW